MNRSAGSKNGYMTSGPWTKEYTAYSYNVSVRDDKSNFDVVHVSTTIAN